MMEGIAVDIMLTPIYVPNVFVIMLKSVKLEFTYGLMMAFAMMKLILWNVIMMEGTAVGRAQKQTSVLSVSAMKKVHQQLTFHVSNIFLQVV